jgi:hypothetical protein
MSDDKIAELKKQLDARLTMLEDIYKLLAGEKAVEGGKAQRNRTTLKKWKNSPRRNGGPSSSRSRPKS